MLGKKLCHFTVNRFQVWIVCMLAHFVLIWKCEYFSWIFQTWNCIKMSLSIQDQCIHCRMRFWKCQEMKQSVSTAASAIWYTMKSNCWKIDLKLQNCNWINIVDWRKEKKSWNSSCSWQQAHNQRLRNGSWSMCSCHCSFDMLQFYFTLIFFIINVIKFL